jgi:hypothetical protein
VVGVAQKIAIGAARLEVTTVHLEDVAQLDDGAIGIARLDQRQRAFIIFLGTLFRAFAGCQKEDDREYGQGFQNSIRAHGDPGLWD